MRNFNPMDRQIVILAKDSSYEMLKEYIKTTYEHRNITDKIVYQKLLKSCIRLLPDDVITAYLTNTLVDHIDLAYKKDDSLKFKNLSIELINIVKNIKGEI